jgi:hypothetical protein
MQINIKYESEATETEIENDSTYVEKQVVYNRKIPKNARLKIKINYLIYL